MDSTRRETWSAVARSLHWLVALMIFAQLALGWIAEEMPKGPDKVTWMTGHKSLGVTILMFVLLRITWRLLHGRPAEPEGKAWELWSARLAHFALYALMVVVPVAGWIAADTSSLPWQYWWSFATPDLMGANHYIHELFEDVHKAAIWSLVAVVAVHILAALRHQFIKRNNVLRRMISG